LNPKFLSLNAVVEAHERLLARFGGSPGIRDLHLLESALAQPLATFGGEFLHEDLFAMAAAYLFHIVKNHPFVDGNKRAGLAAALSFLDVNGISIEDPSPLLHELTVSVAEGQLDKRGAAEFLRKLAAKGT
jgi:death on curing protein